MLPKLANGLEALNIPPLEPFQLESLAFNYARSGSFEAMVNLRKVEINGATNAIIKSAK